MQPRIAFIKLRSFSHINEHLIAQLKGAFPSYPIDVIDIRDLVLRRPLLQARNLPFVLREYGRDLLARRRALRDTLLITTWVFERIGLELRRSLDPRTYAFTFQTQSLFDGHLAGVPHFVYTDHTVLANRRYPDFDPRSLYPASWIAKEHTVYHHADYVFTASAFARDSVIEDYGVSPAAVINVATGVNIPIPALQPPRDPANQEILFVGVEWERKGGPDVAQAFEQVLRGHPQARLTIVGCTPELRLPNTTIVGRIAPEELPPYFERAAIFCLPALVEPAGIAYSEAALYGLPVVATTVGGIPERVIDGETGFLVAPSAPDALAERLSALLTDPGLRDRMGAAGAALARSRFTWDRVGGDIALAIKQKLDGGAL